MSYLDVISNGVKLASKRGGVKRELVDSSPAAVEESPFNAWVRAAFGTLRLRLIRDREVDHIDIECVAATGSRRWVPLEVLAVATNPKLEPKYIKAFKATLETVDAPDDDWAYGSMFAKPLDFVAQNVEALSKAACDGKAIRRAESDIATETAKILAEVAPA